MLVAGMAAWLQVAPAKAGWEIRDYILADATSSAHGLNMTATRSRAVLFARKEFELQPKGFTDRSTRAGRVRANPRASLRQ
jgi:hypothetical protein